MRVFGREELAHVFLLLLHLPHMLHTALHVAAPQHDAAAVASCRPGVSIGRLGCWAAQDRTDRADAGNCQ